MESILYKVGLVCTTIVGFKLIHFFYDTFIARTLHLQKIDWKSQGKWAVVTGSTDGIGKAYAQCLAKKGFDIVLISRTQSKLDAVASEIKQQYKVEVKTIAVDFTAQELIYHEIDKQLISLDIGVLVNNVGMGYKYPQYFLDIPNGDKCHRDLINCNIFSVTYMCKIVMPGMVERQKGIVINISSTSALVPTPLLTVYAATKAYVHKFTLDLAAEYNKKGLIIQSICPGYVATNMIKRKTPSLMAPSAMQFVESALKTVGIEETTTGYLPHTLLNLVLYIVDGLSPKLCRRIISASMLDIKKKFLKKNTSPSS